MEENKLETAVFVGVIRQGDSERKVFEYLDELEFLALTAGVRGEKKFVQRLDRPLSSSYVRSGKLKEIADYCEENEINYVIFDDELSGMQQRNIEKEINGTIYKVNAYFNGQADESILNTIFRLTKKS